MSRFIAAPMISFKSYPSNKNRFIRFVLLWAACQPRCPHQHNHGGVRVHGGGGAERERGCQYGHVE